MIMKNHVTKGSIFDDLGFEHAEAASLKIRSALMKAIVEEMIKRKLSQANVAKLFDVTQPRISDLKRGKIQLFTIDALVNMLGKLDIPVAIIIDNRIAA